MAGSKKPWVSESRPIRNSQSSRHERCWRTPAGPTRQALLCKEPCSKFPPRLYSQIGPGRATIHLWRLHSVLRNSSNPFRLTARQRTISGSSATPWNARPRLRPFQDGAEWPIGCTALIAGALAADGTPQQQFRIWLAEAAVALVLAFVTLQSKSRRLSQSLKSSPARRAMLSFTPPLLAGDRAHGRSGAALPAAGLAGFVAAALWNRCRHRRRILRAHCSLYGPLLYDVRRGRISGSRIIWKSFSYARIRSASHSIRNRDRQEARWLNPRQSKPSNINRRWS